MAVRTYPGLSAVPVEYDTQFYVGSLGDLIALPGTESGGVDVPTTMIGGTHTSLTGSFTRDVFGYRRTWTWKYPLLTTRQAQRVEALQRGMVPGPLYLIDPRRPNRLPEQIASGGSVKRTPDGFIPSNTTTCLWRSLRAVPATMSTLPAARLLRGAIEWQLLAAGGAGLELAGLAADGRHNVPVMPNEIIEVSVWAAGPPAASVGGTAVIYDAAGTVLVTQNLPLTQLSLSTWQIVAAGFQVPSTAAYLRLNLTAASDSPIGSIYTTAYQVARYTPTYVPGLTAYCGETDFGDWFLGGGAPEVVPEGGEAAYLYPGLQSAALTLIER